MTDRQLMWAWSGIAGLETGIAVTTGTSWLAVGVLGVAVLALAVAEALRPDKPKPQGERRTVYPLSPLRLVPGPCKAEGCVRPQSHDGAHLFDVEEA